MQALWLTAQISFGQQMWYGVLRSVVKRIEWRGSVKTPRVRCGIFLTRNLCTLVVVSGKETSVPCEKVLHIVIKNNALTVMFPNTKSPKRRKRFLQVRLTPIKMDLYHVANGLKLSISWSYSPCPCFLTTWWRIACAASTARSFSITSGRRSW